MDVVYTRCCGIDIHKKIAVACVIVSRTKGPASKEIRTFGTMTDDLLALADWLAAEGVTPLIRSRSQPWTILFECRGRAPVMYSRSHFRSPSGERWT